MVIDIPTRFILKRLKPTHTQKSFSQKLSRCGCVFPKWGQTFNECFRVLIFFLWKEFLSDLWHRDKVCFIRKIWRLWWRSLERCDLFFHISTIIISFLVMQFFIIRIKKEYLDLRFLKKVRFCVCFAKVQANSLGKDKKLFIIFLFFSFTKHLVILLRHFSSFLIYKK